MLKNGNDKKICSNEKSKKAAAQPIFTFTTHIHTKEKKY